MASDPAYLETFKEFTKSLPGLDDQELMDKEFYGESDRACGILQAGWTELIIERNLRGRLRADGSAQIFDANGPLASFSNKITMAYGLGVFGIKTRHDLNLIRHLRNGFAHCRLPLRFSLPEVKGICDHLFLPDIEPLRAVPPILAHQPVDGGGHWYDRNHPRERFIICCYTIVNQLFLLAPQQLHGISDLP